MRKLVLREICSIGMRPCSDQEAREDGAWDWREEGRLSIGQEDKEGRPGADDGCSWMVLIQWKGNGWSVPTWWSRSEPTNAYKEAPSISQWGRWALDRTSQIDTQKAKVLEHHFPFNILRKVPYAAQVVHPTMQPHKMRHPFQIL